jgi:hypothetical protein
MELEKLPTLLSESARRAKQALTPPQTCPLPELPSKPDCFPAEEHTTSNYEVSPERWALTVAQWNEFVQCCKSTDRWRILNRRSGYVSAHDACNHFVKPWTRGTGRGVALSMNAAAPMEAQLMLSHTWAEDLAECAEALNTHCRRSDLAASTSVWFCLFSNYQAGDEEGDVGPTVAEQLAMDPFGHVIRSAREQRGMLVIHTSRAEVYERLWCVYEIATALREDCTTRSACSRRYADTGRSRRRLQNVLDVNTTNAKCSSEMDEAFICARVSISGGFERLDKEIFHFRVSMLLEQAEEAGHNYRLQRLTKAITKVEKRLELENSSSSSSGSWASKLGAYRWLCLMLAFLALCGVTVAVLAMIQRSQDVLSDVGTATKTPTPTPAPIYPILPTPAPSGWIFTPSPTPVPTPDSENTWTTSSPTPTTSTTTAGSSDDTSPDSASSDGGSPWGGFLLVRCVILIGGAVATIVLLVVALILFIGRPDFCSRRAGDAAQDTAGRQTSRRVQLERLVLVRQMVEGRVQQIERQRVVGAV